MTIIEREMLHHWTAVTMLVEESNKMKSEKKHKKAKSIRLEAIKKFCDMEDLYGSGETKDFILDNWGDRYSNLWVSLIGWRSVKNIQWNNDGWIK